MINKKDGGVFSKRDEEVYSIHFDMHRPLLFCCSYIHIIVCVLRDSGLSHVKVIPFLLSDEQRDCLIQTHFHTSSGVSYVHDILCYWPPECSAPGQNVLV